MARQIFTFRCPVSIKKISPKKDNPSEKYALLISNFFDNAIFADPKKLTATSKEGDAFDAIITVMEDGNLRFIAIVSK